MSQVEHLRHCSDALLRLSREAKEPGISAKLQEMADEFRIMVCVADVTDLAADLARDCAGGRDGRQEADKDRIGSLPKRQRKRGARVHRTEAKAAPSPLPPKGTARRNARSAGATERGREAEMAPR
jgi:hypothetical protein